MSGKKKCTSSDLSAGEKHVKLLSIRKIKTDRELYEQCRRKFGTKGLELLKQSYGTGDNENYSIKNSDYDFSMFFSGGYDYDYIKKVCNWIDKNKESFGKRILEIGCDCGFITTFLALNFPESHITSINREQSGIDIAKQNCQKLGITNVEFICGNIIDFESETFDTVVSMRTIHENYSFVVKEDPGDELLPLSEEFFKSFSTYASKLASLVKDNGTLVSVERTGVNSLFLGWIKALSVAEMHISTENYSKIECDEVGDRSQFQALICKKEEPDEEPFDVFMHCFAKYTNITLCNYSGWDAKIMYAFTGKKLIEGYIIKNLVVNVSGRVCIAEHYNDKTCIVLYCNHYGDVKVEYWDVSKKDAFLSDIHTEISKYKDNPNFEVTRIEE